ncbi:T-cell surface glycoprotein CD3 delta chain isoform X1 [Lissotriton helveticus]
MLCSWKCEMKYKKHFNNLIFFSSLTGSKVNVTVMERHGELVLECEGGNWESGDKGKDLNLGALIRDPRGTYTCQKEGDKAIKNTLQVYVRMCENCIELDPGTISGIVVADVIITVLIAVAVYCVSGTEKGRPTRGKSSDKQVLIPNDQLYQPLRDREESAYSHISASRPRRK